MNMLMGIVGFFIGSMIELYMIWYKNTSFKWQHMILLNGLLAGVYAYNFYLFGWHIEGMLSGIFITVIFILTLIDWKYMLLPTQIIQIGSSIAILGKSFLAYLHQDRSILIQSLLGGAVGYGVVALVFYLCLWILKKEGMGYGDVRYLGMIGLFTSPSLVFLTLFVGSLLGSVYGFILYRRRKESMAFCFGPFLSIGACMSLFYGERVIHWYMNLWSI